MSARKGQKADLLLQLKREWLHTDCVNVPPVISVEVTGVCVRTGKSEILLAAIYRSQCRRRRNTIVIQLLGFRNVCVQAWDLHAKYLVWNIHFRFFRLFHVFCLNFQLFV